MKYFIFIVFFVTLLSKCEAQAFFYYQQAQEYYWGINRTQSHEKAFALYLLAAKNGCFAAEREIGNCYLNRHGVEQSDRKAFSWTKKAAKHGDSKAMYQLSTFYFKGIGCKKSDKLGFKYAWRAANQGNMEAIEFLQQFSLYSREIWSFSDEDTLSTQHTPTFDNHCYDNLHRARQHLPRFWLLAHIGKLSDQPPRTLLLPPRPLGQRGVDYRHTRTARAAPAVPTLWRAFR